MCYLQLNMTVIKEKGTMIFYLIPHFFAEKCTSSQNFAYFCTKIVDLLLRDTSKCFLFSSP